MITKYSLLVSRLSTRAVSSGALSPFGTRYASNSTALRKTSFTLNTGHKIPALGFGTFQDAHAQEETVCNALKAGFRLIDTARVYGVEAEVGRGIKKSGVARQEIFLGTKLWCNQFHPDDVEGALDESLADLDTPYVDLLMMHYPVVFKRGNEKFPRDSKGTMILGDTDYLDTWRAMEKLVSSGKVKAIGVSNFCKSEIEKLISSSDTVPAVHQMETHPYLQQKEFNSWLQSQGIHVIQFSPLGNMNPFYRDVGWSKDISHMERIVDNKIMLDIGRKYNKIMLDIGRKYNKTAVQVALAWGIANGRSVIPKSVIDWQVQQNLEADFELTAEDMEKIATLDLKARFNDPSLDYQYRLYSDLEGIEGTKAGFTH